MITNKNFNKFLDSILNESFDGYDESGKPQFNMNYEDTYNSYFRGAEYKELKEIIFDKKWTFGKLYDVGQDVTTERESAKHILKKYPYFKSVARSFSTNTWRFSYDGFFLEFNKDYVKSLRGLKIIPTNLYGDQYEMEYTPGDNIEQEERIFSNRKIIPVNPNKLLKAVYFFNRRDDFYDDYESKNFQEQMKQAVPQLKKLGIMVYMLDDNMVPEDLGDGDPYMQPESPLRPYELYSNMNNVKREL